MFIRYVTGVAIAFFIGTISLPSVAQTKAEIITAKTLLSLAGKKCSEMLNITKLSGKMLNYVTCIIDRKENRYAVYLIDGRKASVTEVQPENHPLYGQNMGQ